MMNLQLVCGSMSKRLAPTAQVLKIKDRQLLEVYLPFPNKSATEFRVAVATVDATGCYATTTLIT